MNLKKRIVEKLQQCECMYFYTNCKKDFEQTWLKSDRDSMQTFADCTIQEHERILQFILNELDNETTPTDTGTSKS